MPAAPRKLASHKPRSVDAVFMARAVRAFEGLIKDLPKEDLSDAVSAPSDFEVVLSAMVAARKMLARSDPNRDPFELARLRGQQARLTLLTSEGGTLTASEVSELLGISRQAVNKRRQAGSLLALSLGRHGFAYPAWQFAENDVLPGLREVLHTLAHHDPWMQARFFLNPDPHLGDARPLDELRQGRVEAVSSAASDYAEHGAA